HLGRRISHRHSHTPTPCGSARPCPGIKGVDSVTEQRFSPMKYRHSTHPQRPVMSGQHRAGEVAEASCAHLAPISLPVGLGLSKAIADYAAAGGVAATIRPIMLAHQSEALGTANQRRQVTRSGAVIMLRLLRPSRSAIPPTIKDRLQARYRSLLHRLRAQQEPCSPFSSSCDPPHSNWQQRCCIISVNVIRTARFPFGIAGMSPAAWRGQIPCSAGHRADT
ncbi:hypothetical protein SAMN04487779_10391, partial [Belnapia rosea]